MVIPTRQAPPVPTQNRGFTISNNNQSSRYTPTTDWDDNPFDAWTPKQSQAAPIYNQSQQHQQQQQQQQQLKVKKQAPPRPPPPKTGFKPAVPLKKPSTVHSNTILANLLSRARLSKPSSKQTSSKNSAPLPQSIAPASSCNKIINNYGTLTLKQSASFSSTSSSITSNNEVKLISFDSPPSSPTFTQKSNSDCVSVNSFSSDSANYSPNNGFSSESGFEDDFVLDNKITSTYKPMPAVDPFDMLDEAFTPTMNTGIKPPIAQKPVNVGNTSFYAFSGNASSINPNNSKKPTDNYDPLCNGKDLIKPSSVVAPKMPTIIRPNSAGKGKISPVHSVKTPVRTPEPTKTIQFEEFDDSFDDSLPSLPMPSIPPPPPPKIEDTLQDDTETESYGIALYDFDGEQDADLPLRANEKIYLMRRLNDEWLFGRNKRGCEGMFPANFIDVKIPLSDDSAICSGSSTPSVEMGSKSVKVKALYDFHAEHPEDLSLTAGDTVTVLRELNSEWLYGETSGRFGQFPANYVDYQLNSY
uniref:CSON011085 protein n=1 Tax=Culicoides sonorensis TaxID=179676 RepID=A0A336LME0_CULSO